MQPAINILFKDKFDNIFYIEKDVLYVKGATGYLRKVGRLSYNLDTNKANLTVYRKAEEKYLFGYFISAAVFEYIKIDKVTLIVDNKVIYLLEWDKVSEHVKPTKFKPTNGMEEMYEIPMGYWHRVGEVTS